MPDVCIAVPTQTLLTRIVNAFAKMPDENGDVWDPQGSVTKADHARKVHALLIRQQVKAIESQQPDADLDTIV